MWQTLHAQWVCDSKRHFRLVLLLLLLLLLSLSVLRLLLLLLVTTFISRPATFVAIFYGLLCVSVCGKDFLHLRKQLPTQTEQLCLHLCLSPADFPGWRQPTHFRVCFSLVFNDFSNACAKFSQLSASSSFHMESFNNLPKLLLWQLAIVAGRFDLLDSLLMLLLLLLLLLLPFN